MKWFKLYANDFLVDPKMSMLNPLQRLAWIYCLCLASIEEKGGDIPYLTEEMLKVKMGLSPSYSHWKEMDGCLESFEKMKMITRLEFGVRLINFHERQNTNLTPAEKMARYRAKNSTGNESYPNTLTKVALDKIREDNNTVDESTVSLSAVPLSESGEERVVKQKKPRDMRAWKLRNQFVDICESKLGIKPDVNIAGYVAVQRALKKLTEAQIKDLFEEWFGLNKPEEQLMSLAAALSTNQINGYRARNL